MQQSQFESIVKHLCQFSTLPEVLAELKKSEEPEIVAAAMALTGQFAIAEVENEQRIYHVTSEMDEQGEEQEFVEHVMNEGEDVIKFIAWFFESQFEVKRKDTYQAAGKTYQQPKRL